MSSKSRNQEDIKTDNTRRIKRMEYWIEQAGSFPADEDHNHIRFLFYYIAYEAAYQKAWETKNQEQREDFHCKVARNAKLNIKEFLDKNQEKICELLELRQAHPLFWKGPKQLKGWSREKWESEFNSQKKDSLQHLEKAIKGERKEIIGALNDLFQNLSIIRNQIVHGGSAGRESRGRTQVNLGAELLGEIIHFLHNCIEEKIQHDWGSPPFPRVGNHRDEVCLPPGIVENS